ncbi:MAG: N-acyl-D-amino-acid deacylase family protein [Luteitalea sp.]
MHRRRFLVTVGAAGTAVAGAWAAHAVRARQGRRAEVLIRGAQLHDGRGGAARFGDLAIGQGRILGVGELTGWSAARTIDASGRVAAPGFIDAHSHAAEGLVRRGLHTAEALIAQGVTTIVANPDGGGPLDLIAQRARMATLGVGVNVAPLIGHGVVRAAVLEMADRAPTAPELERMQQHVRDGLRAGAFGLSSGLFYAPGSYARTDEVVALMRIVAQAHGRRGLHTSHIRDEGTYTIGLLAAVDEIITIAESTTTTGVVSHIKALGPDVWGKARDCAAHIEAARTRGVSVYADQYPYEASSNSLAAAVLPRSAQAGGRAALDGRLADPATRAALLPEVRENIRRRGGPASLVIAFHPPDRRLEGQSLEQVATARKVSPEEAALAVIAVRDPSIVSFNMALADIEFLMRQPWTMTCSDGAIFLPGEGKPHPRGHGAFTRKLTAFVRDRHTVPLEQALRSMTSLPAEVLSLSGRGVLEEGAHADVVVFDPAALRDQATYQDPHRHASGMSFVFVNGQPALDDGRPTGATAGLLLRREESRR